MKNAIHMLDNVTSTQKFPTQMNSFIIEMQSGELIVIDGGFRAEWVHLLSKLREISGKNRPKVAGWFLSHAHFDHIDCFKEVVENRMDEIDIERVYFNFPSIQFFERNEPASAKPVCEFYDLLPKFADKAVIVTEGDRYQIGDAVFEILNSPNVTWSHDAVNNSSVAMRMYLGDKTALFLGDMAAEAGEALLEKYGSSLKSDICQMSHHGQKGVNKDVYCAIAPEVCFWCTPLWLWDNDTGEGFDTSVFRTVEVRNWMDELGVVEHHVMKDGDCTYEIR